MRGCAPHFHFSLCFFPSKKVDILRFRVRNLLCHPKINKNWSFNIHEFPKDAFLTFFESQKKCCFCKVIFDFLGFLEFSIGFHGFRYASRSSQLKRKILRAFSCVYKHQTLYTLYTSTKHKRAFSCLYTSTKRTCAFSCSYTSTKRTHAFSCFYTSAKRTRALYKHQAHTCVFVLLYKRQTHACVFVLFMQAGMQKCENGNIITLQSSQVTGLFQHKK